MPDLYSDDDIESLEALDLIRLRPRIFVGDLDAPEAVDILLQESLCVSLDALLADLADELRIEFREDGSAAVRDNGSGLPLETLDCGKTVTELIFGSVRPGCRHLKHGADNSKLCGPGMACVTALSKWLTVDNSRDGAVWQTRFIRGVQVGPAQRIAAADSTGIEISFLPDPEFFHGKHVLDFDRFCAWFDSSSIELPKHAVVTVHCARTQKQATLRNKRSS